MYGSFSGKPPGKKTTGPGEVICPFCGKILMPSKKERKKGQITRPRCDRVVKIARA
jgi:uncharacterized Zn finger protein (UPF0148 family)